MDIQTAFNSLLPNVLKYINITNMHILILNEDFQKKWDDLLFINTHFCIFVTLYCLKHFLSVCILLFICYL